MEPAVRETIASLDSQGRWIVRDDRFRNVRPGGRWNGEYTVMDRLSSRLFCSNVDLLCEYLELRRGVEP